MADKRKRKITRRQKQKRKLILLGVELVCFLVLLVVLYVWSVIGKIDFNPLALDDAGINEDLADDAILKMQGYTNIALFGLDNRTSGNYDTGHSDSIIIASINNKTKEIRLVSVYRDTYLRVNSEESYSKANSAYYKGGPEQAVKMLNSNLDLNITEYACVDWAALVQAIDALGGVEIEITAQEAGLINAYLFEIDAMMGTTSSAVDGEGLKTLTGAQATSYARIRKTAGDDFKRSSRQRIVIEAMLNKAKSASVGTLLDICNVVFDDISTSLELSEILGLAVHVKEYQIVSTSGFPFAMTTKSISKVGDSVIPIVLEDNVKQLHGYLFGTENYETSNTVRHISNTIIEKTGVDANTPSINTDGYNDTAGQTGTVFD
ncbi:MAG: LCP family protein [Agathobacter sp.]|nr:LCP family protein [Agathobacter sp.]